jgi:hypothetical protein
MTYTVSSCFLENADIYDITGVLDELSNKVKGHQVAKDRNGEIIDIYREVKSKHYNDLILSWLNKLTMKPLSLKLIEIDLSEIECIKRKFLTLCKETADKTLIVASRDDFAKYGIEGQRISFNSVSIKVLNKKEAKDELNKSNATYIDGIGHQISGGNMIGSNNKNNFK